MKLYTEEQVIKAMVKALGYSDDVIGYYRDVEVLNSLTPIELPSDEEIEKAADELTNIDVDYWSSFLRGAKWMKEQILNQNK